MERGSFLTYIEWGGWEAARLPWEKEIGEIPQDAVRGSSALPHRKVFKCGIALVDTTGISRTATECALSFLCCSAYDASVCAMELDV
ncbi:hypothetical protein HFA01_12450 [Halobacillus faecis]|uniref:Uncharacterized protein n=1 Tax=Halobacillus faecis TaxID=360184 RepID=A0A511WRW0_9BACI|nr:hypothetical protein HFA01_12450 [Halobacillus faecis]